MAATLLKEPLIRNNQFEITVDSSHKSENALLSKAGVVAAIFVEVSDSITTSLTFTEDGNIENVLSTPTCRTGERINLLSYSYMYKECRDDCVQMEHKNLSLESKLQLHYACSFKETCTNFTLSFADSTQFERTILNISFICEDSNIRLVNPCAATTSHYNTSFHLKIEDPLSLYNDCQCFIKDGEFRIYSVDIRLQSPDNDTCSLAKLQVNSETYKCDADSSTFGSVFNTEAGGLLPRGFVSLTKPRLNGQFQMAWLIIKPTGWVSINCASSTWLENSITTETRNITSTTLVSRQLTPTPGIVEHPYPNVSSSMKSNDKDNPASVQTFIIGLCVGGGVIAVSATFALLVLIRRRCRHRDEKDDYIQPVYKRNDPIQDKGQLALANTCSRQQKGACGPSFSPGTGHINRIGGRVVDKPVNENGEGAYYLELKEGSGELIYDSLQETHAVYEQMKDEREDKDPGYAELDSIKCNADGYCVPFTSRTETPANVIKTEHLKESVKCNNDGYCVPFTSRPETPANDNNTVYLKDHVKCNTGEYSVPCIIRQKTPSKIDKAGHLKDSVKYNTDGYSVPFTYGPGLTTHLNKIEHSDAQLSNSKTKLKTENDDYLIPIADKSEVAYN